ncbi:MAG: hypothetical protein C4574_02690 [Candidatus Latescibacterota bacterium]|nr:MAG: hypothetical protein C4574_02690 [Candidatus Latescibacterota bacterium]
MAGLLSGEKGSSRNERFRIRFIIRIAERKVSGAGRGRRGAGGLFERSSKGRGAAPAGLGGEPARFELLAPRRPC